MPFCMEETKSKYWERCLEGHSSSNETGGCEGTQRLELIRPGPKAALIGKHCIGTTFTPDWIISNLNITKAPQKTFLIRCMLESQTSEQLLHLPLNSNLILASFAQTTQLLNDVFLVQTWLLIAQNKQTDQSLLIHSMIQTVSIHLTKSCKL